MQDKASKDEVRLLKAQIGNLKVQNSEYQQIVAELTEKLEKYKKKYGSVFTRALD